MAVETPSQVEEPVVESATEVTPPEPQAPERISHEDMRTRIREGQLSEEEDKAFLEDPEKFVSERVIPEGEPPPPEETVEQAPEVQPDKAEPTEPEPKQPPSTVDDVVSELEKLGFKYPNIGEALKGFSNKEEAVVRYKDTAKKLQQQLDKESASRRQIEAQLKELEKKAPVAPPPPVKAPPPVELPDMPKMPEIMDEEDKKAVADYQQQMQAYMKSTVGNVQQGSTQQVESIKKSMEDKIASLQGEFSKLTQTREQEQAVVQAQEEERLNRIALDNAVTAVERLQKENPDYKTTLPIKQVHEQYTGLMEDINFLQKQTPALAGRDLLNEYHNSNPDTMEIFRQNAISVPEDIKTYQLMVALEGDAKAHNDMEDGIPDLTMALLRHKKKNGIIAQEMVNQKVAGFDEHERIAQATSQVNSGTIPVAAPPKPPADQVAMTNAQVLSEMRRIKEIPNREVADAEWTKLKPHLEKLGFQEK